MKEVIEKVGLDASLGTSENFDLSTWNLNVSLDEGDGTSINISVSQINAGYQNNEDFYIADDGGMVFKCPIAGFKTSKNTKYTRSKYREMLRDNNTSIKTQGVNRNN